MPRYRRVPLRSSCFAALAASLLLLPADASAKGGAATEVTGFQVEIAGAGSGGDVDSAWETCSGGALCIETSGAVGGGGGQPILRTVLTDLTLQGPIPAARGVNENSYEILENGAGRFRVEIDGTAMARDEVSSVYIDDIIIGVREEGTGAPGDARVYGPGDAHFGAITIRSRVGKDSKELYQWWQDASRGKNIRKNISVICLKRDGAEARRFDFHACQPTCYAPFEFDPDRGATQALTLRCEGVSLSSTGPRKALCEWITDVLAGRAWRRTVTIKEITKDGGAGKTFAYFDCFPTRYVFPQLDASGKGVAIERVVCKMGRVELQ